MLKDILKNLVGKKKVVAVNKADLLSGENAARCTELQKAIHTVFGRSLRIRQVDAGSCNACEWECIALTNPIYDVQRFGIDFVASPRHADVILVTGPVSRQMELALKKTWLATPEPRYVIACGNCTIDGGVFKDSYAVTNGAHTVVPVDCYIPGCPPEPMDLIKGLLHFIKTLTNKK